MSNHVDDWHKLVQVDTNIQAELQANLLRNNDIAVSVQALSIIPGMNSGAVLWVQQADLSRAQAILQQIRNAKLDDLDTDGFSEGSSDGFGGSDAGDGGGE